MDYLAVNRSKVTKNRGPQDLEMPFWLAQIRPRVYFPCQRSLLLSVLLQSLVVSSASQPGPTFVVIEHFFHRI